MAVSAGRDAVIQSACVEKSSLRDVFVRGDFYSCSLVFGHYIRCQRKYYGGVIGDSYFIIKTNNYVVYYIDAFITIM